jgi:membrane fusion protein (multidrug efflux system)
MNRNKTIIAAILTVLVVLIGFRVVQSIRAKRGAVKEQALIPVEVLAVAPQDFDETLSLTGTVMAENQTDVPAKMPGKVIRYLFEEGAWVEKGQTIVTIDRDEVGVEFKETVVEAPIAGWLTKRYFDTGAHINPGMPLAQIADYHRVKLVVSVPEADISRVRTGAGAKVTIDAWPDNAFDGYVSKVSPTLDYLSRTAKAEIGLGNPGLKLRPGMYGRATVRIKHHAKAMVIPTTAVLQREGATLVFVVVNGKAAVRAVTVDVDMGETSAIKAGLAFGDKLIVAGQHSVSDGSDVKVIEGK